MLNVGRWTNTASLNSNVAGHKKFSDGGVATYGSTVAIGTKNTNSIDVFTDAGSLEASLVVTSVVGIAMYGSVIVGEDVSSIFVFEKISSQWTRTATHTTSNILNVAIYSNFIAIGRTGMMYMML